MTQRLTSPDFVGRERELAGLVAGVERAVDGRPAVALVSGESGIGKTRLVTELADRARAQGARVLPGDCVDLGDGEIAYAPIIGALRGVESDGLTEALGSAAWGLAPLLPQLGQPAGESETSLSQGRVFELLLALLGRLADEAPLVVVFEDVHWADRSSRDFLAFFVRNAGQQRVLLIATYRTDELHRRHPLRALLAEAERAPIVERVALQRFTREEIVAQLTGILGHRPDPRMVDDVFARAEGNAFFTEELAAAAAGERLPANLVDALMLRVEALSAPAQAVLRLAAVAGPRVSHGLLERAAGMQGDELVAGLREAVAHNVIVTDADTGAYRFRHALMREALADDLLPGERVTTVFAGARRPPRRTAWDQRRFPGLNPGSSFERAATCYGTRAVCTAALASARRGPAPAARHRPPGPPFLTALAASRRPRPRTSGHGAAHGEKSAS